MSGKLAAWETNIKARFGFSRQDIEVNKMYKTLGSAFAYKLNSASDDALLYFSKYQYQSAMNNRVRKSLGVDLAAINQRYTGGV